MPTMFILGRKGGGKTLRAMREMEKELKNTRRTIVTNFPVRYERFREYLVEKYGEDFGYTRRMVILSTQQTAQFWLYYGLKELKYTPFEELPAQEQARRRKIAEKDWQELTRDHTKAQGKLAASLRWRARYVEELLPTWARGPEDLLEGQYETIPLKIEGRVELFESNEEKKKAVTAPDFSARNGHPGVCYFLDEIHITFNSRKWTRTGEDCLYYTSLERHFGDDQWLCTQCFANVDRQLRDMGQEYWLCVNQKKAPLSGTFGLGRKPGEFVCSQYTDPPLSKEQEPFDSHGFPLDRNGIASCYTTVAESQFGVDSDADKKVTQRGKIPFSVLVVIVGLLGMGTVYGMYSGANWVIGRGSEGTQKRFSKASGLSSAAAAGNMVTQVMAGDGSKPSVEYHSSSRDRGTKDVAKPPELFVTGTVNLNGVWHLYLSDGRELTRGFQVLDENRLLVDGRVITWKVRHPQDTRFRSE